MRTADERRVSIEKQDCDVVVVGGGLCGLAASIHLARAGFRVICFDPQLDLTRFIGESLDWSAPELFAALGLHMDELVRDGVCTYKDGVALKTKQSGEINYIPSAWLGEPLLNIGLRTLHVDRRQLHARIVAIAAAAGVTRVVARVTEIERDGRRIRAVTSADGKRTSANWFVDASGANSALFARKFRLRSKVYGPAKVAVWSYFHSTAQLQKTTLHTDAPRGRYMEWIWEIPINPNTLSVGYVATGETIRQYRHQSLSVAEIYRRRLSQYERFSDLLNAECESASSPNVTSFYCRVFKGVCGPNWVIIGEAASTPDPITGNGVTAALRHAQEASHMVAQFRRKGRIPWFARATYNLRAIQMARFFNSLIEKLAYEPPIRDRIGLLKAGDVYTAAAWSINHLYSRFGPTGMLGSALWSAFVAALRSATWLFYWALGWRAARNAVQSQPVLKEAEA